MYILNRHYWPLFAIIIIFLILMIIIARFLPGGIDWHLTFRPAALAMISGRSPYEDISVKAPYAGAPWGLLPLIPLALLPEVIGRGLLFGISSIAFAFAAIRLGAKTPALVAFLLSPPVLHSLLNANLDWIPLLGFALPPQIGLFLLAVKPQMGSVVALFWLFEAWREGKWRKVFHVFAPISITFLVSFIIFGFWPLNMLTAERYTQWWNASLWPTSIPVGLALAIASIRLRQVKYAMAASPSLSPHVLFHSWSSALIAIVASNAETIAAVIGLWILVIIRAYTIS
jgi:hypothetical protein